MKKFSAFLIVGLAVLTSHVSSVCTNAARGRRPKWWRLNGVNLANQRLDRHELVLIPAGEFRWGA